MSAWVEELALQALDQGTYSPQRFRIAARHAWLAAAVDELAGAARVPMTGQAEHGDHLVLAAKLLTRLCSLSETNEEIKNALSSI